MSNLIWNAPEIPKRIIVTHKWTIDYASEVHNHPEYPRPWTDLALSEFNFEDSFIQNYKGVNRINDTFLSVMDDFKEMNDYILDNHDWGYASNAYKRFRDGFTRGKISDSESLKDSYDREINYE